MREIISELINIVADDRCMAAKDMSKALPCTVPKKAFGLMAWAERSFTHCTQRIDLEVVLRKFLFIADSFQSYQVPDSDQGTGTQSRLSFACRVLFQSPGSRLPRIKTCARGGPYRGRSIGYIWMTSSRIDTYALVLFQIF